jgi:hypothetical protein
MAAAAAHAAPTTLGPTLNAALLPPRPCPAVTGGATTMPAGAGEPPPVFELEPLSPVLELELDDEPELELDVDEPALVPEEPLVPEDDEPLLPPPLLPPPLLPPLLPLKEPATRMLFVDPGASRTAMESSSAGWC